MHFGGVSPINALNRDIIARLEAELREGGIDLPCTSATVTGIRWSRTPSRVCVTTASGTRSCFPHRRGAATPGVVSTTRTSRGPGRSGPRRTEPEKLRQYYDHPLMVAAFADAIHAAREQLSEDARTGRGWCSPRTRYPSLPTRTPVRRPRAQPLQPAGRRCVPSVRRGGGHRRLRPGVAVALRSAAGAVARPRHLRSPRHGCGVGRARGDRVPGRIRLGSPEVCGTSTRRPATQAAELGIEFVRRRDTGHGSPLPRG